MTSIIIPTGRAGAINRWGTILWEQGFVKLFEQSLRHSIPGSLVHGVITVYVRFPTPAYGGDLHRIDGAVPMGACSVREWSPAMWDSLGKLPDVAHVFGITPGIFHGLATATDNGRRRRWMTSRDLPEWSAKLRTLTGLGFRAHMLDAPEWVRRVRRSENFMRAFYTASAAASPGMVVAENPSVRVDGLRPHTTVKAGDWDATQCKGVAWTDRGEWTHILHDPALVEAWRGGMPVPNPCIPLPKLLGMETDDE